MDAISSKSEFTHQCGARLSELLNTNWTRLEGLAAGPEAGGKVKVGFALEIDLNGKLPEGAITMRYAEVFKMDSVVKLPDPDQPEML